MVMSKIPISKMTLDELRDYASDLYKDGYSRMSIFRLTDGKLSERQIRKIYKKADKNPLLKEWHKENMKRKQSDLNKAVKGRINTLKLQGKKATLKDRKEIIDTFREQSFSGMYKRNHPKHHRYKGKIGTLREYIEEE